MWSWPSAESVNVRSLSAATASPFTIGAIDRSQSWATGTTSSFAFANFSWPKSFSGTIRTAYSPSLIPVAFSVSGSTFT